MSSSVVYILDLKGKVLISRNYRGDIDMGIIDKFMPLVMDREEEGNMTPIIQHGDVTFSFIKYNNLYLVSVTKKNANVAMVFQFLHKVVQVTCCVCSLGYTMYRRTKYRVHKPLTQRRIERLKDGNVHMCFSSRSGYSS